MIKKLIIKLFKVYDITDMLLKAKQKQKQIDDKYWNEILAEKMNALWREYELELQEKDSDIAMLGEHLATYKKKEREVINKEFLAKKQVKENHYVVQSVVTKMYEFNEGVNKIYGEMLGIKDTVEQHKRKLENISK